MTALREYQRLEATGLWRPTPADQRREVVVSVGDATLTITNSNNQALTHWSLAAVERVNPGQSPAIYAPDGDPGETLELAEDEAEMIAAIERLRHAVERARPRPGRLRLFSGVTAVLAVLAITIFVLPDALVTHTVSVVPEIKRKEIGADLVARITRVTGQACDTGDARAAVNRLESRTGADQIVVLENGFTDSRHLPGGIILLNKALIEDFEDPAVMAGYVLSERVRSLKTDPLRHLLDASGPLAAFRLLTTGTLDQKTLDDYAAFVLTEDRAPVDEPALLNAFSAIGVPSTPYAYARDVTGETVLGLIEADPMAGRDPEPVLPDRDWILLQNICGG
ncbi:MAG: hypothetical protein AB3N23_13100 [Paracoccaceae bacterium]